MISKKASTFVHFLWLVQKVRPFFVLQWLYRFVYKANGFFFGGLLLCIILLEQSVFSFPCWSLFSICLTRYISQPHCQSCFAPSFVFFRILSFIHPLHVLYYVACWSRMTKKPTKMITEERQWTVCFRLPSFSIFLFGLLSWSIFVGFCCVLILRGLQCFSSEWVARKKMYITSFLFPWCPLVSCVSFGYICLYIYISSSIIFIYHDTNKALTISSLFVVHFASASFTTFLWFSQFSEQQMDF